MLSENDQSFVVKVTNESHDDDEFGFKLKPFKRASKISESSEKHHQDSLVIPLDQEDDKPPIIKLIPIKEEPYLNS